MNTKTLKTKDKSVEFGRSYTWKKEWVRPYESPFSVFRNFCRVNVCKSINSAYFMISDEKKGWYTGGYKPSLLIPAPSTIKDKSKKLTPKWYTQFISRMSSFGNIYDRMVWYCPECIKENYHSVFHNVKGVRKCFLHGCDLLESDAYYDLSHLTYVPEENDNFHNVRNFILPSGRRVEPSFYNIKGFHIPEKISVLTGNPNTELHFLPDILFSKTKEPVFKMRAFKLYISYELHNVAKNILSKFKTPDTIDLTSSESSLLSIHNFPTDITYWYEYYLYYRRFRLMDNRREDLSIYELIRMEEDMLRGITVTDKPEDDILLRYSFIWATYPVSSPYETRSLKNIIKYNSLARTGDMKAFNCSFGEYLSNYNISKDEKHDLKLAQLWILQDEFDFLWEEYKKLAARPQGVNSRDGWRELKVPGYYVIKDDSSDTYSIYRTI